MNRTRPTGPIAFALGGDSVTASYSIAPSPYAILHVGSALTLHATPGVADPAVLRDLAAKASEIANWLEQDSVEAGELDAA
ncbi:hypothetical protein DT019_03330 [Streptomyces sp. SDr-06]|uniref:hypothetical protein n=1 Tax=Streptomyces sp. SDr-06 TaxID=2267702 RepID=UPI000DE8562A|nr:hypothetical protein [Streptomyces sp. SDr-06]RCH70536.1 hypothetical protein DT019_03330 [Streptomyces sp. SDr-06]